ncbi:hypothetical protein [Methylobacterium segetis]|uniref:hypothetical protein n=1 Tax=Methylobacterium segetis TaxID=2488750 RepID=UPI0010494DD2|nr:hypothetical protein [Methylobacterium segetis]
MTTLKQIKSLSKDLLDQRSDLILIKGHVIWLKPIDHVGRTIRFDRSSCARRFYLSWEVTELYAPEARPARSYGCCGQRFLRRTGSKGEDFVGWDWDDPAMPGGFRQAMEESVLPMLHPLDSLEKALAFVRGHQPTVLTRGWRWHLVAAVALGELDAARDLWRERGHLYWKGEVMRDPQDQFLYDRYCEIGEPLMADDRASLARILQRWEAENVRGTAIEPYWAPTPFPLEREV